MSKKTEFSEEQEEIGKALVFESPRGCVLAAHGHLDRMLEELLISLWPWPASTSNQAVGLSGGVFPSIRRQWRDAVPVKENPRGVVFRGRESAA